MQSTTFYLRPTQNLDPVAITVQKEFPDWLRLNLHENQKYGNILLDFSGEDNPDLSQIIDGSPRLVIHRPNGDAILFIRLHPNKLIIDTEVDVRPEVKDSQIIYHYGVHRLPATTTSPAAPASTPHLAPVFTVTVHSDFSPNLITTLARMGCWLEYTPGPDHHDQITVKDEEAPIALLLSNHQRIIATRRHTRTFDHHRSSRSLNP